MIILNKNHLKKIEKLVHEYSGILFARIATKQLEAKIVSQMKKSHFSNVETYISALTPQFGKTAEMDDLVSELTVSESSFFRNPDHFEYLLNNILPNLYKNRKLRNIPIRIFSAGCACGEEPYSIAFIVRQFISEHPDLLVRILAGDINSKNINHAKRGIYQDTSKLSKANVFEETLQNTIFDRTVKGQCKVLPEIQSFVQFTRLNLRDIPRLQCISGSDIIFCRNVLIYFDEQLKLKLVNEFYKRLNPGGILLIGEGECLPRNVDKFQLIKCGKNAYGYQKAHKEIYEHKEKN